MCLLNRLSIEQLRKVNYEDIKRISIKKKRTVTHTGRIPLVHDTNCGTWNTQMEAILHKNRALMITVAKEMALKVEELPNTNLE